MRSEVPATLRTKGEFLQLLENVLTEKANPGATPKPVWMRTSQSGALDATGQKKNLWHTTIAPRLNLMSSFRSRSSKKKKKAKGEAPQSMR